MNITIAQARAGFEAIQTLTKSKTLPAKLAFRFLRISGQLTAILKDVSTTEQEIVERFTERDEAGDPVPSLDDEGNVLPDHIKLTDPRAFGEELASLFSTEVTVDAEPITEDDFGDRDVEAEPLMVLHEIGLLAL